MYRCICRALLLGLFAAGIPFHFAQAAMSTADSEPKLALIYNSQAGNGLLDGGWSLGGLSAITRCPKTMAKQNPKNGTAYHMSDHYCLDGQQLIAVKGRHGADGTEYTTEQGGFAKIVSHGATGQSCATTMGLAGFVTTCDAIPTGPAWFQVWTRSGQVIEFGNTDDSRIETRGQSTVGVWALNRLQDAQGNYLTVSYDKGVADGGYRLRRIDYAGNVNTKMSTKNSVQFNYGK